MVTVGCSLAYKLHEFCCWKKTILDANHGPSHYWSNSFGTFCKLISHEASSHRSSWTISCLTFTIRTQLVKLESDMSRTKVLRSWLLCIVDRKMKSQYLISRLLQFAKQISKEIAQAALKRARWYNLCQQDLDNRGEGTIGARTHTHKSQKQLLFQTKPGSDVWAGIWCLLRKRMWLSEATHQSWFEHKSRVHVRLVL